MTRRTELNESGQAGEGVLSQLRRNAILLVFFILSFIGMLTVYSYYGGAGANSDTVDPEFNTSAFESDPANALPLAMINKPRADPPTRIPPTLTPHPKTVAIIAGHRASDSGTECEDGLTEVQLTSALAERVAAATSSAGVPTFTLDEFDNRLGSLQAAALVSIHIDSCDFINDLATGYKIVGSSFTDSSELSICIQQAYGEATNLTYHTNSITPHMANYHAFRKIPGGIPAIIIEVGFLNLDRQILTTGSDRVVEGLTQGILCYMEALP